jgi:RNA polymerase sigma-70 factor (ECF subfamily)
MDAPDSVEDMLQRGYRYALALTHDRTTAEDLLHDAWANVLSRRSVDSTPYLIRAIRNRWIDLHRRRTVVPMGPITTEPTEPASGADLAISAFDEVGRALGSLTAEEREALYLNAVEGWTASEIAALAGRPRNTILTVLARARHRVGGWRDAQRKLEVL